MSKHGDDSTHKQKASVGPAYQAHLAEAVKNAAPSLVVGSVGGITDGHVAQKVLDNGQADVVLVGRAFLKNPGSVWAFADALGVEVNQANQIHWAFKGRRKRAAGQKVTIVSNGAWK